MAKISDINDGTRTTKRQPATVGDAIRKRGSKSASIELNMTATNADVSEILNNSLYWYNRPIVRSDEECADRLNEFFQRMAETGEVPTVEKMCLSLGTVRRTVFDWQNGTLGNTRAHMIKKAKEILASMDAELVSKGKIPQITYIFRAKNYFGLRDQQDIAVSANTAQCDNSPEDLARYAAMLPGADEGGA